MKPVQRYQTQARITCALIVVTIPVVYWILLIYSFNKFEDQAERMAYFYSFFPGFLTGNYLLPILVIMLCVCSMVLSSREINSKTMQKRFLGIAISFAAGCLMLLTVFSLM